MDGLGLAMYPLPWFSFTKPWFADENSSQAFGRHQVDPAIDLDVRDSLVPATRYPCWVTVYSLSRAPRLAAGVEGGEWVSTVMGGGR